MVGAASGAKGCSCDASPGADRRAAEEGLGRLRPYTISLTSQIGKIRGGVHAGLGRGVASCELRQGPFGSP
jgi:hypothetical protein